MDWKEIGIFMAVVLVGMLVYNSFIAGSKIESEVKKLGA